MVTLHKLHKIAGLAAGLPLFLLAVTGFFLDHDAWPFLYRVTTTISGNIAPDASVRLVEGYRIDPANPNRLTVCTRRGIYESDDGGRNFQKMSDLQCLGLAAEGDALFAATDDGIYWREKSRWLPLALKGAFVNAITVHDGRILASVDKSKLYLIDRLGIVQSLALPPIDPELLRRPITLARFVRDLHYGRGIFESPFSLWLNDYGAVVLAWLALGGFLIWRRIRAKKGGRTTRRLIKLHANLVTIAAGIVLVVLAVTGIFLDHARGLGAFMKSVTIPSSILPPVYGSLRHDIWSVDLGEGGVVRIGNRYGVFAYRKGEWRLESPGFAYRMIREGDRLYVSGMGASNRIYENGEWHTLPRTPHMFRAVVQTPEGVRFFSPHGTRLPLPALNDITLYTLLLGLHDGTFFASWWPWVDDTAALALLWLLLTGTIRWWKKKYTKK